MVFGKTAVVLDLRGRVSFMCSWVGLDHDAGVMTEVRRALISAVRWNELVRGVVVQQTNPS